MLAAGCLMRLIGLDWRSIWLDEAKTIIVAAAPFSQTVPLIRGLEGIPPLYFYLLHLWLFFWDDPGRAVRVFSALCGIAALPFFYLLCRNTLKTAVHFAFFLGCFSSYWINISQDARVYPFFLLVSLLQLLAAWDLNNHWSRKNIIFYSLAGAVGLYTHIYGVFFLLSLFLSIAAKIRHDPKKLTSWIWTHALILSSFLPWGIVVWAQMKRPDTMVIADPLNFSTIAQILGTAVFNISLLSIAFGQWMQTAGYVTIAGLALGLGLLLQNKIPASVRQTAIFFAMQLLIPFFAVRAAEIILHRPIGQARYFVFITPPLYLLIALITEQCPRLVRGLIQAGTGLVFLSSVAAYEFTGTIDPGYGRLAQRLRENPYSQGAIVHTLPYDYVSMRYYYLQERTHYLLCPNSALDWGALPGYSAIIDRKELSRINECVFIDARRKITRTACSEIASHSCS